MAWLQMTQVIIHPLVGFMYEIDKNSNGVDCSIAATVAFKDKKWSNASFRRKFADK